ncbi:hypothetical protein DFQ04_3195 [Algoriphagus boseongensis]|uniref:Uncharacterized protein n=2 Tax=Algoriphagus boseongensis TaxID=1442587 RepID=A0A4R6T418_9BACT|nr:hypothetical protein DFQ04_3195 [Algoriphagus boseongensis]
MLKRLVLGLLIILPRLGISQCDLSFLPEEIIADSTIFVEGKNYKGYIFPVDYHGFILDKSSNSVWLTKSQIKDIEEIFIEQHNDVLKNDQRVSRELKYKNDVEKQYRNYYRQYLGFKCENGDLCAKILLLNRSGKGRKYSECFDKVMVMGHGEFYEKNQRLFIVNISKSKLILP